MIVPPLLPLTPIPIPLVEAAGSAALILVCFVICLIDALTIPRNSKKGTSNAKPKAPSDN